MGVVKGNNCTIVCGCLFTDWKDFFKKFNCRKWEKYFIEGWGPVQKKAGERFYSDEIDPGWECVQSIIDKEQNTLYPEYFIMKKGKHVVIVADSNYSKRPWGICDHAFVRNIWDSRNPIWNKIWRQ